METLTSIILVVTAGLLIGSMGWPMKVCKNLEFGHMWLSGMIAGLLVAPWAISWLGVPDLFSAYAKVPFATLVKANAFSLAWGIANVLMGVAIIRIGASLTMAILTGIGASIGVVLPMVFKGSGLFASAPSIVSLPGLFVVLGVAVMLVGVMLCARSGDLRETVQGSNSSVRSEGYAAGLLMVIIAGILSAGISFTFIFSQDDIVSAVKSNGAGTVASNAAVWAVALVGGMLVNIIYPAVLISRAKSWGLFTKHPGEVAIAAIIGIQFFIGVLLMGQGMLKLGPLGASVGFGMAQGMQIVGGQLLGFISGEWRSAQPNARKLIFSATAVLLLASAILAVGNFLQ